MSNNNEKENQNFGKNSYMSMFEPYGVNIDRDSGIHYGVIGQNELSSWALDDVYQNGTDMVYEEERARVIDELKDAIKEVLDNNYIDMSDEDIIDNIEPFLEEWNQNYENYGDNTSYDYESDGFHIQLLSDGDIFVLKSPFYTYCNYCSPCAPNAGCLTSPNSRDGVKTYCLGDDWFDDKVEYSEYVKENGEKVIIPYGNVCPYKVYRVEDDVLVYTPEVTPEDNKEGAQ
jgi:hypothetical protein